MTKKKGLIRFDTKKARVFPVVSMPAMTMSTAITKVTSESGPLRLKNHFRLQIFRFILPVTCYQLLYLFFYLQFCISCFLFTVLDIQFCISGFLFPVFYFCFPLLVCYFWFSISGYPLPVFYFWFSISSSLVLVLFYFWFFISSFVFPVQFLISGFPFPVSYFWF